MNTYKLKATLYLLFFLMSLLLGLIFLVTEVKAIGQISEPIIVENALRSQEIEQTMSVLNTDNNEILFGLDAEGDIVNWTSFYELDDENHENPITETKIEAKGRKGVRVIFRVPEDTANGTYTGYVSVFTKIDPEKEDEGVVTVQQRIPREVSITITDQEEINFSTAIIADRETILGEALKVRFIYYNEGNTVIKPQIEIKARQNENIFYNVILPYPENEEGVKPLQSHEIKPVQILTSGAIMGVAVLEVKITYQGETVEEKTIRFRLSETGDVLKDKLNKTENKPRNNSLMLAGGGLVVLAMGFFAGNILFRRFKRKPPKRANRKSKNGKKRTANGSKKSGVNGKNKK